MSRGKIVIYSPCSLLAGVMTEIVGGVASRVVCCQSIEQTVATCQREEPDLVIILSIKPFLNGSGLIAEIRQRDKRRPPIYVVSWQQAENVVLSLLECGVDQYFTFPICIGRLRNKAAEELKHRYE
ncbi:MAG: response regulator transcription factor [Alistipes sp.]|nr:response regulator transcription factor [Rikenellaceae bacterium]MBO4993151.1 response regulator transcription factor [Alistipes sp.]MBP3474238.1 response regulator transcription factor [Alistipes sp.]MBQ4540434.1 response regulator transcription factor [Alistipes sp.]MBR3793647.1 response regulator transcription factor [Alistipes sp.]